MSRKDQRRRERLMREQLAKGKKGARPEPSPDPHPFPPAHAPGLQAAATAAKNPVPGNTPWPPGTSGNPAGYSRGRRFSAGLAALITARGADPAVAHVWLTQVLKGDRHFFKMMLQYLEGMPYSRDRDPDAVIPLETLDPAISPDVAERLMAAADPDIAPVFEEDEPACEP